MNLPEIHAALQSRFALPEFALMFEVRSGTGHNNNVRYADALALSLWPSRGLELIGFEVKVIRSDWLRELKEPQKADRIGRFCDRWYVVAGAKDIVLPGELPSGWGLMVPRGDGLSVSKEAPPLTPEPISRSFLASLMRAACAQSPAEGIIAQRLKAALSEQASKLKSTYEQRARYDTSELSVLRQAVEDFERASGVSIRGWRGKKVGEAVNFIIQGGLDGMEQRLRSVARTATEIAGLAMSSADCVEAHVNSDVSEVMEKCQTTTTNQ